MLLYGSGTSYISETLPSTTGTIVVERILLENYGSGCQLLSGTQCIDPTSAVGVPQIGPHSSRSIIHKMIDSVRALCGVASTFPEIFLTSQKLILATSYFHIVGNLEHLPL